MSPPKRHHDAGWRALATRPTAATTALAVLGIAGLAASLVFPAESPGPGRDLLIVLSGTLLVAGALNHLLPSRDDVPPEVLASVVEASWATRDGADELAPTYVPGDRDEVRLRLAVDGGTESRPPKGELRPTGLGLYRTIADELPEDGSPTEVLSWLAEALEGRFALVSGTSVSTGSGEATVRISEWVPDGIERVDHPATSLLAVGLADRLDRPVGTTVRIDDGATIRLRWEPASDEAEPAEEGVSRRESEEGDPDDEREAQPASPGRDGDA